MTRTTGTLADDTRDADEADGAELRLQQALRSLPPPVDADRLEALQSRVLAQWRANGPAIVEPMPGAGWRSRSLSLINGSRRAWVIASCLVLGMSLAAGFWLQRPDPALDELLQPDVLSQMAIGEM